MHLLSFKDSFDVLLLAIVELKPGSGFNIDMAMITLYFCATNLIFCIY